MRQPEWTGRVNGSALQGLPCPTYCPLYIPSVCLSLIHIFRDRGLSVVTNPASNLKLASGIAPIKSMMDMGINIAIGTDGPASNNCLDMFREMFLTTALAKLREQDASAVDAGRVLYMATVGGARAMGLKECDVLAPGKKADMIMLDLDVYKRQQHSGVR